MGYARWPFSVAAMSVRHRTKEHQALQRVLRSLRIEKRLSQAELAQRLQKPQSYVSKYESGERRLDLIELRQICGALNIGLVKFVERFDKILRG